MKILIADDEKLECDALEKMLQLHFPEISVLPSVYDGLELVKNVNIYSPDIVIVDINMPNLDGLAALELLHKDYAKMEILIHTAYNNFEYIHKALKIGAADYLVKPVFEDDFIKVFKNVLKKVYDKNSEPISLPSAQKLKEHIQVVTSDNIMMGLLLNQKDSKSWRMSLRSLGFTPREGWILSLSLSPVKDRDIFYSLIADRLKDTYYLFSIIYHEILYCLILSKPSDLTHTTSWDVSRQYDVQTFTDLSLKKIPAGFEQNQLPDILHHLAIEYDLTYTAGISGIKTHPEQFSEAVFEADTARKNARENSCRFFAPASQTVRKDQFGPLCDTLAQHLTCNGLKEAAEFIKVSLQGSNIPDPLTFADQYFSEKMIVETAHLLKMDKRRTGMKWTIQNRMGHLKSFHLQNGGHLEENDDISFTSISIEMERWIPYLQEELYELSQDFALPLRKSSPYVEFALHQMNSRYMEDFSLEQLACDVGITQFYLSRLLKQERNQTFMEILTDIRISHALELMTDPTQNAQTISQSVGYTTKYFYQIFRNIMGVSQKAFRDALFIPGDSDSAVERHSSGKKPT